MRRFFELLSNRWRDANTFVCVGLDPILDRIPSHIRDTDRIFSFNKAIVDATAEFACAFKPQVAHYSAVAAESSLERTIEHIRKVHPDIPVILDAKRGDIGSTAEQYAKEAFERYDADAVTVNPWLGYDSVEPFLRWEDRGVIILCRTSNPSAVEFQELLVDDEPIFLGLARRVVEHWNQRNNCMLVVGATASDSLRAIREVAPNIPFLVPGIGAQGGDIDAVVKHGVTADGFGLVINSSRSILYAASNAKFDEAARTAAKDLRDTINRSRSPTQRPDDGGR